MARIALLSMLLFALAAPTVSAQPPAAAPAPAAPTVEELRSDYLMAFDGVASKLRQLAEAIPEEQYRWRPAAGVRSVAELFGHVAGGNYFFAKMCGVAKPEGVPENLEKLASKKEVTTWLESSLAHVRAAAAAATAADLAKEVDFFGTKTTARGVYLIEYGHLSEHLGQAIAYARSVGVAPPWSRSTE